MPLATVARHTLDAVWERTMILTIQGQVPELKQGRSHGESEGANSACGCAYSMRVCPSGLPLFQLRHRVNWGTLPCMSPFSPFGCCYTFDINPVFVFFFFFSNSGRFATAHWGPLRMARSRLGGPTTEPRRGGPPGWAPESVSIRRQNIIRKRRPYYWNDFQKNFKTYWWNVQSFRRWALFFENYS